MRTTLWAVTVMAAEAVCLAADEKAKTFTFRRGESV